MRTKPPNRRPCENIEFVFNGHTIIGTIGKYVDADFRWMRGSDNCGYYYAEFEPVVGEPCEVFFSKRGGSGTDMESLLYDQGVSLSIALQSGTSIEDISKSVCRTENGMAGSVVGAMVDLIANERKPFELPR